MQIGSKDLPCCSKSRLLGSTSNMPSFCDTLVSLTQYINKKLEDIEWKLNHDLATEEVNLNAHKILLIKQY